MRYLTVYLDALSYELAPNVVSSAELEKRVAPVYEALRFPVGQLEALTGIKERRWWDAGYKLTDGAAKAGKKALERGGVKAADLGALVYAGVCRDGSEPATACAVAASLGVGRDCAVYDISNACLGVLSGIVDVANRIELGHVKAGLVVSCESAREINESMIASMIAKPTMDHFKLSIATLTADRARWRSCSRTARSGEKDISFSAARRSRRRSIGISAGGTGTSCGPTRRRC